jgi:hypothetical protein
MEMILEGYGEGLLWADQDKEAVIRTLQSASDGQIIQWAEEVKQLRLDAIDAEEAAAVKQAEDAFRIKADDLQYSYLFDKALKDRTEAGLAEIDFTQMVFDGFSEQEVMVVNGMKIIYRTVNGLHALWLERQLHQAANYAKAYGEHWMSLRQLATSIQVINGRAIGTEISGLDSEEHEGKFNKELEARLKVINKLPTQVSDLLIANLAWFNGRVRKSLVGDLTERVGNS